MPERAWVVNSSPLIVLSKIRRLDLLCSLCRNLVIPMGVVHEINEGPQDDPARVGLGSLTSAQRQEITAIHSAVAAWDLGPGETDVLSWAKAHPGFEAIIDDRAARNCAASLGIPVRGTLGLLLLAKREGLLSAVRPLLEQVMTAGLRVSTELVSATLALAGE